MPDRSFTQRAQDDEDHRLASCGLTFDARADEELQDFQTRHYDHQYGLPLWRTLPLRKRGKIVAFALVDAGDYEALQQFRWRLSPQGYANRCEPTGKSGAGSMLLHRHLLGLETGNPLQGDHINGNRLDNRRMNLRVVTDAANKLNVGSRGGTSKYRGVRQRKDNGRWQAYAHCSREQVSLGCFGTEDEAAFAVRAFWLERGHDPRDTQPTDFTPATFGATGERRRAALPEVPVSAAIFFAPGSSRARYPLGAKRGQVCEEDPRPPGFARLAPPPLYTDGETQ